MFGKLVAEMTDAELAAYLNHLDRTIGSKDSNGLKAEIRAEIHRRGTVSTLAGVPENVIDRNPLVKAEKDKIKDTE